MNTINEHAKVVRMQITVLNEINGVKEMEARFMTYFIVLFPEQ